MKAVAAVAFVAACGAASASENYLGGFVLGLLSQDVANTTAVNPDDIFDVGGVSAEVAFGLEGRWNGAVFRTRGTRLEGRGSPTYSLELQELSGAWELFDGVVLTLGKTQLQWDFSQNVTPLGFFQRAYDSGDPFDSFSRSAGLPLFALTWADQNFGATFVYSNDIGAAPDGLNRGLRQWALRLTFDSEGFSSSAIARYVEGDGIGLGGAVSMVATNSITVYASVYAEQGSRTFHNALLDSPTPMFAATDPNIPSLKDDGRIFGRATVGTSWAVAEDLSLSAELSYDRSGLSATEWERWRELVSFHRAAYAAAANAASKSLAIQNLGWDANTLRRYGTRRAYGYFRGMWDVTDGMTVNLLTQTSLEDGGSVVSVFLSCEFSDSVTASVSGAAFLGGDETEAANLPTNGDVSVGLRYAF